MSTFCEEVYALEVRLLSNHLPSRTCCLWSPTPQHPHNKGLALLLRQTVNKLDSPYILKMLDFDQLSNCIMLAFAEGGSLADFVDKRLLDIECDPFGNILSSSVEESQLWDGKLPRIFIQQMLLGLKVLHQHDVAHRDMKVRAVTASCIK